jgi:predicted dienelactone hydrolase
MRRRRAVATAVLLAVVAVVVVLIIPGGSSPARPVARGHGSAGGSPGSSATSPASSSATTAPNLPRPPYPVGVTNVTVDDAGRILPTVVRYPAADAGNATRPLVAGAPYPLIVFSQGYAIAAESYASLLARWAAAGFVVADPSYPDTTPGDAGGLDEADIVNHPADLRAVISTLVADGTRPGSLLSGMIDSSRVGVAGHSDGGDVSDAVAEGTCCRDPRVTAAVILSGAELAAFGGSFGGSVGLPLLVVQGSADDINVPACSEQIYDNALPPRYYLDLTGAGHHVAYLPTWTDGFSPAQAAAYREAVTATTILFWRAYLDRSGAALHQLQTTRQLPGAGTLTAGPAVAVQGSCPGAPAG